MADKTLNILENIEKGISPSYLGNFNKLVNLDLSNVRGGATSSYRLRLEFPYLNSAGMGAQTFTANASNDTCTASGSIAGYWASGQSVRFTTTDTLPAGLSTATTYYAISLGSNTFKVASSLANLKAGTAVNITDAGTGTHTVTPMYINTSYAFKRMLNYGTDFFGLDGSGQIWYRNTSYGDIWVHIGGGGSVSYTNIVIWKKYLLATSGTANEIGVFGSIADMDTAAWQTWDAAETPTFAHGGGANPTCIMTNGILYIGDDNDIASLEEVAGDVFDPTDATSYVWNNSALDLPTGTHVSALEQLGDYLMVGTFESKYRAAKIYPWDTFSDSFYSPILCSGDAVMPMKTMNGVLYFFTADRITNTTNGKLYATNGTSIQEVATLQNDGEAQAYGDNFKVYRGGIDLGKDKLYFGVGGSYRNGVYSYNSVTGAITLEHTSASLAETGVEPSAVLYYDDDLIVGLTDTTYETGYIGQIQRLEIGSTYRKYVTAYAETGLFTVGTKYQPKTYRFFEIQLGKELASGEVVTLSYRTNLTDSFTTIGTMSYASDGAIASKIIENSSVSADQIQFKITITCGSSATVAPELKAVFVY